MTKTPTLAARFPCLFNNRNRHRCACVNCAAFNRANGRRRMTKARAARAARSAAWALAVAEGRIVKAFDTFTACATVEAAAAKLAALEAAGVPAQIVSAS
jgi:hypothetical protein